MSLNTSKCEVITFTRRHQSNVVTYDYHINGSYLRRVEQVKDLGVILDSRMTFKPHVDQIIGRVKSMLGFIKRQAKSLYCALVRPLLEYCSVVWDPVFKIDSDWIESVQRQFLLFALRGLGWADRFGLPAYEARLSLLG